MNKKPEEVVNLLVQKITHLKKGVDVQETGRVAQVGDGVVTIYGLDGVRGFEVVRNDRGAEALVLSLDVSSVGAVILGAPTGFSEGDVVHATGKTLRVPVGEELLGRVVSARGVPIDDAGPISTKKFQDVEVAAPAILDRRSVDTPLQTGVKAVDALVPIGRGQRELIIGDRQVGKTALVIDAVINQALINESLPESERVYSVYVAVGQKMSKLVYITQKLREFDALKYTIIVAAPASENAAHQFLAPYVGCAMGEYFRDKGSHALVIYDDLSKQAVAYREISLLLRRPPGREAFPGDIFYLHARLLERAAQMSKAKGGGSLTALPIVETQEGDLAGYIATNVISITDGQIFLETGLFHEGVKPAVNVGNSVSRVGSAAQSPGIKKLSGQLRLELAQYREMAAFAKFATDANEQTQRLLRQGDALVEMLKQPQYQPVSVAEQLVSLFYFARNFDEKKEAAERIERLTFVLERLRRNKSFSKSLNTHKKFDEALESKIETYITESLRLMEGR